MQSSNARFACVVDRMNNSATHPTGSLEVNSGPHGRNIYTAREGRFARRHAVRYMYEMLLLHMCMKRYVVLSVHIGAMNTQTVRATCCSFLFFLWIRIVINDLDNLNDPPRECSRRIAASLLREQRGGIPRDAETPSENSLGGRGKDILVHCSRGK